MNGSECRLIEYMEGSKKRFIIPVYQRNYDWKIENCKQLYDDLNEVIKYQRKSHFFGSLVSVYNPSGRNTEFLVIDGQQRLTTISLLLLAMYNLLQDGFIESDEPTLANQIYEDFLVDKYQPQETRMKLKPVKKDNIAFCKLFDNEEEYIFDSNLTINYLYFYERIKKQEITIDELFDAICRLEIINITLNHEDNPQLIFESLNSTGLDLSEGDKIRNFILMGLPSETQNLYYDKFWHPIEQYTKYNVSSFVRDFLSIKQQSIPPQKQVYVRFKEYTKLREGDIESLLQELLAYAKRYKVLLEGKTKDVALNACIQRLNRLETTVTRPFFLEVLRLYDENLLTIDEVSNIFSITESYIFRRSICDLPTNSLNKIFLTLHKDILRYDSTTECYVEKLKYTLLSRKERLRFPDDEEFAKAFSERPVFLMNGKNKVYILERLENYGTREDKDVYRHYDAGKYSIEHIMPQHLTPKWVKELGEDYEQIHQLWLHRIANLTLTAYNSKYSDRPFYEKKYMPNGFIESGIRLNTYVAKQEKWTLHEMEERSEYLTNRALQIWSMPNTNFKPIEKQLDVYTLADEDLLTGRILAKFSFRNIEQPVTSWVEMYQKVLQTLYEEDKTILTKLAVSKEEGLASHFSTNASDFLKSEKIGDGIFVLTNTATKSKLSNLNKLFNLYGIDPEELSFYLRDDAENSEQEDDVRYELRRKYWAYALELLHEVHGEYCYKNVNPTKNNWLDGFTGINGIHICCVANYDSARVELYIGKASKMENKQIFDKLQVHKEAIEKEIGNYLIWSRRDDIKSCKVYCQLDGVSIQNEADWLQMAQFHAKWSKRFYDVIVPYLNM